ELPGRPRLGTSGSGCRGGRGLAWRRALVGDHQCRSVLLIQHHQPVEAAVREGRCGRRFRPAPGPAAVGHPYLGGPGRAVGADLLTLGLYASRRREKYGPILLTWSRFGEFVVPHNADGPAADAAGRRRRGPPALRRRNPGGPPSGGPDRRRPCGGVGGASGLAAIAAPGCRRSLPG